MPREKDDVRRIIPREKDDVRRIISKEDDVCRVVPREIDDVRRIIPREVLSSENSSIRYDTTIHRPNSLHLFILIMCKHVELLITDSISCHYDCSHTITHTCI